MTEKFENENFFSELDKILFDELPVKASDKKLPDSPAVWFAIDNTKPKPKVLYIGKAKNLCQYLSRNNTYEGFKENNVLHIAYWQVEEEKREVLAKKAIIFFAPPLNNNESKILVPAVNNLIQQLKKKAKQREIGQTAGTSHNYLNKFEEKLGADASKLEKILLSDLVDDSSFDYFIQELQKLWKNSKEKLNGEQQPKLGDNAALDNSNSDSSKKKIELLNKPKKTE
jgi:hypothetical protein